MLLKFRDLNNGLLIVPISNILAVIIPSPLVRGDHKCMVMFGMMSAEVTNEVANDISKQLELYHAKVVS